MNKIYNKYTATKIYNFLETRNLFSLMWNSKLFKLTVLSDKKGFNEFFFVLQSVEMEDNLKVLLFVAFIFLGGSNWCDVIIFLDFIFCCLNAQVIQNYVRFFLMCFVYTKFNDHDQFNVKLVKRFRIISWNIRGKSNKWHWKKSKQKKKIK